MRFALRFYRLLNHLSIDVAAGAMIGSLYFASVFATEIKRAEVIVLGLTVWIIYTTDHLRDARRIVSKASTPRHSFHQQNFKILVFVLLAVMLVAFAFSFFVRGVVLRWGALLSALVCCYFLLYRYLYRFKEIVAAFLYTAGIVLPALAGMEMPLSICNSIVLFLFMTTALINLLIFSWFDRKPDAQDQQPSFVTIYGEQRARQVIYILFLLHALLLFFSLFMYPKAHNVLIFIPMNVMLLLIFILEKYFLVGDRYRLAGDAIFFLPLFCLLK